MQVTTESGDAAVFRIRLTPGEGQGSQVVIDSEGLQQLEQVLELERDREEAVATQAAEVAKIRAEQTRDAETYSI